jgi:hypothetical protein
MTGLTSSTATCFARGASRCALGRRYVSRHDNQPKSERDRLLESDALPRQLGGASRTATRVTCRRKPAGAVRRRRIHVVRRKPWRRTQGASRVGEPRVLRLVERLERPTQNARPRVPPPVGNDASRTVVPSHVPGDDAGQPVVGCGPREAITRTLAEVHVVISAGRDGRRPRIDVPPVVVGRTARPGGEKVLR